ncbi:MAG: hypothetical protein BroJett025_07690 [Patescibacteria group bacterium]|nr:MAG: hypothetical protein BroJett025_07690 [Patescibacteria group bacterium]
MNIQQFLKAYYEFLIEHTNPQRAKKEKAYLYSDFKHYGIAFGLRSQFIKKYKKELAQLEKTDALNLIDTLWHKDSFEEKMLALDVLGLHAKKIDHTDMPFIEHLLRTSKGWALLDSFIIQIMPGLLEREPQTYDILKKWITDSDFWVRRSALLSQLLFFRKNNGGNKKLFFDFAVSQFDEGWIDSLYKNTLDKKRAKFFIRKAIGWALREMSVKDPQPVFKFLKRYKNEMSGLSFREGSRKLPEELKKLL